MKITRRDAKHPPRVSRFVVIIPILMQIHWTLGRFISDSESPRRDGGQPFTVEKLQEKNRGKPFERSTLVASLLHRLEGTVLVTWYGVTRRVLEGYFP